MVRSLYLDDAVSVALILAETGRTVPIERFAPELFE
jgi:hypothetical protein